LTSQVAELQATIADLTERLGRTPRNSSMPPSAEGLSSLRHGQSVVRPPSADRASNQAPRASI